MATTDADIEKLAVLPVDTIAAKVKGAKDKTEKGQYIRALYRFKPKGEKDIATLANLSAEDGGKGVASEAAFRAMENVGSEDKALAPAFVKLLDHKNGHVQYVAMEKCGLLRSKEALPKMIKRLKGIDKNATGKDDEWRMRGLVVGLGNYGKDGLPELLQLRKETKDDLVRHFTEGAINAIKDKEAVPLFMEIIRAKTQDVETRGLAIQIVGRIAPKESLTEFMGIYKEEKDVSARYNLIDGIGNSKSESVIPFLEQILNNDGDKMSRISAAHALEKIGGSKVVDILSRALENEQANDVGMDLAFRLKNLTGKDYDWRKPNEK